MALAEPIPQIAVVLAGGLGTRLRAAVADRPKVLAEAAGRPFLDYVLSYLAAQGVRRVILCVGYLADQVRAFAGDGQSWGLELEYSHEEAPLGTGGALRLAGDSIHHPFFALNGDSLFRADLLLLWQAHRSFEGAATIALMQTERDAQRGCAELSSGGRIISFVEKPDYSVDRRRQNVALVNAGVYVLEPEVLASIPPGMPVSIEQEIFPRLANMGRLYGQVQEAYFADIGTPESLSKFEQDVINHKVPWQ